MMQEIIDGKKNSWFLSSRGERLFPLSMTPDDIHIEDIGHSLSNICRFGGHCREFYSVAQHSVIVSDILLDMDRRDLAFLGLLHDATEAYCGDMVRPLKLCLPEFKDMENQIWESIADKFNLPVHLPDEVLLADDIALMSEKRDLLPEHEWEWSTFQTRSGGNVPVLDYTICPWPPRRAEHEFMGVYDALYQEHTVRT